MYIERINIKELAIPVKPITRERSLDGISIKSIADNSGKQNRLIRMKPSFSVKIIPL
tara:strand:- start:2718 stop:2888 length:171 start_codon:yes stop_codon:yes gene_type:complete